MVMDLDTLAKLGEFVGGAVVVVSLLYLALQAKQSAQQQRSENFGRTIDRVSGMLMELAKDPELNHLLVTGSIGLEYLSPNDRLRLSWLLNTNFSLYEFIFHQHNSKVLPDFVWDKYSKHVDFWISLPGVREWWKSNPGAFTSDFMENVEARLSGDGHSVESAIELWGWGGNMPPNQTLNSDV